MGRILNFRADLLSGNGKTTVNSWSVAGDGRCGPRIKHQRVCVSLTAPSAPKGYLMLFRRPEGMWSL